MLRLWLVNSECYSEAQTYVQRVRGSGAGLGGCRRDCIVSSERKEQPHEASTDTPSLPVTSLTKSQNASQHTDAASNRNLVAMKRIA